MWSEVLQHLEVERGDRDRNGEGVAMKYRKNWGTLLSLWLRS